jgi:hypothetical protein
MATILRQVTPKNFGRIDLWATFNLKAADDWREKEQAALAPTLGTFAEPKGNHDG